ncbi:hypothetical protein B0I35DRAFT_477021 [Stachybotrys elegans]|uniref:Rhodopsin domain-containing protein n=1 Tax=Stachybotrys elegans TaxID=80388 RepID=A0A8K0WTS6_9HYPO|nr:hypothetical protein B0I35DRAFT_477021 [Stachybotrys elegans]
MGQIQSSEVYNHKFFDGWNKTEKDEFLFGPAMTPPPGIVPNFEDPPNRTRLGFIITTTCLVITSFFWLVRVYSRLFLLRRVRLEDFAGLVAMGMYVGVIWSAYSLAAVPGFWINQWNVRVIDMSSALYALHILPIMYILTQMFGKVAILLEWIHLFVPPGTRNTLFWTCTAMIVTTVLFYTALFIAQQFYCTPYEKIWNRWVPGTCLDRRDIELPSAYFNVVTDFLILLLPQRVIWNLNTTLRKRLGVSVVFSIGLLACASAVGRTIANAELDYEGDVTYGGSEPFFWGLAECTCALLVFSIHAVPLVFASILSAPCWGRRVARYGESLKADSSSSTQPGFRAEETRSSDVPLATYERLEEGTRTANESVGSVVDIVTSASSLPSDTIIRVTHVIETHTVEVKREAPESVSDTEMRDYDTEVRGSDTPVPWRTSGERAIPF